MQSLQHPPTERNTMEAFNDSLRPLPAQLNHREETAGTAHRFRRILAAVDFSDRTYEILRCAMALAERADAVLDVLHVIELNIAGEEHGIPRTRLIREMSEAAQLEMHKLLETLLNGDVIATISVRAGRADQVILREAGVMRGR